jgi:hypothetical protein
LSGEIKGYFKRESHFQSILGKYMGARGNGIELKKIANMRDDQLKKYLGKNARLKKSEVDKLLGEKTKKKAGKNTWPR